jgi:hypothetical protein
MVVPATPFYNSLWDLTVNVCHEAQVPLYIERHDPKVFTTMQKIYMLFYKAQKKLTLRGLIDDLSTSTLVEYLGLSRIPDFSMLSHFLKNISLRLLRLIDAAIQRLLPTFAEVIVDSTGFECTHPSHYFCQRIDSPYPSDRFVTLFAAIDCERGFIRASSTRTRKVHDSKMFKTLIRKLLTKPLKCYADRGFDSEENYRFLIEEIKCFPFILQKNMLKPVQTCTGAYRAAIREIFDYGEYLKRNKIEGVNSCLKTRYGCALSTRALRNQHKELPIKVIIYNLERKLRMTIVIVISRRRSFQQDQ